MKKPAPDPIEERVLTLLRSPRAAPMTARALARRVGLHGDDGGAAAADLLGRLEARGLIARIRGERFVIPERADLMAGRIQFHERGDAHLIDEAGTRPDLHIAAGNTGTALQGDRVLARLLHEGIEQGRGSRRGRAEGRVVRILERARETVVGTLRRSGQFHHVAVDDPRFSHDIYVRPERGARGAGGRVPALGDKVVVRLLPWDRPHLNPEGEIVEVLGASDAPGIDVLSIIRRHQLAVDFPADTLREAEATAERIPEGELARREDHRAAPILTIDPDDAKDYDDAVLVERSSDGWRLGVHIADVAHYVAPGSALDREALRRGNSVYLADRVLPMLPECLSNGVCSLRPGQDRLTRSVFIEFDQRGAPRRVRFARTVIRSAVRLSYPQAFKILGRKPATAIERRVHLAWELAALLRERRLRAGALDLDFPEVKVRLDAQGRVTRLEKVENDASHQLIEEFMLAANEAVAAAIRARALPCLYRVHEAPDPDKLGEYRALLAVYGIVAGDLTQRAELRRALAATAGRPEEHALKVALLRSLKRAMYDVRPAGHYGLAKANYTHFTSPIRRYADLVVHRVLDELDTPGAARRAAPTDLSAVAAHVSATEREAAEAETESVRHKQLEYFRERIGTRHAFDAVAIDARSYGVVIELPDQLISGLIRVSSLPGDFYRFDAPRLRFVGVRTRRCYGLGDRLRVHVESVDLAKGQINFRPVCALRVDTRSPSGVESGANVRRARSSIG